MQRFVADLGNSRLKWGQLGPDGRLASSYALAVDDPEAWSSPSENGGLAGSREASWAIASVNPPLAARLEAILRDRGIAHFRWFRSAADVPVPNVLEQPETAGADRALAVTAAVALSEVGRPGLVVSCGSAITVERVSASGVWEGGAIAPGLGLSARALHELTAQLPLIAPRNDPPAWGRSTRPALEAGIYWGAVGAVRELIARQAAGLAPSPWIVWTGGDAPLLAPRIDWAESRVVPDLVLLGLVRVMEGAPGGPDGSSQP